MKKYIMGVLVLVSLMIVGCVDVNNYLDVKTNGVVKMEMVFSGEPTILSMVENAILEGEEFKGTMSYKGEDLVMVGFLKEEFYTFRDDGNWFKHRYVFEYNSFLDEGVEMFTINEFVNMPGKVVSKNGFKDNPKDNGYELHGNEAVMTATSECYLFFC